MSDAIVRLNPGLEGRYPVEREVGADGMATVWVGWAVRYPSATQGIPNPQQNRERGVPT